MLGWIALVPWLAVLDRTRSRRGALAYGFLMTEMFVLVVFRWFPSAIQNYTGAPYVVALIVVLLAAPVIEPQFITFALARRLARDHGAGFWRTSLVGACVYVGTEWASPKLFADTLGHGLYGSVLMRQAADLAGAHGLTFVLVIANECARTVIVALTTDAPRSGRLRRAVAPATGIALLAASLLGYGTLRCRQFRDANSGSGQVTAGIVQANIAQYGRLAAELGTFDAVRLILDAHFRLSTEVLERGNVDFLIWPETVYPTTFGSPKSADGAAFDRQIGGFVTSVGVPLVFGAYDVKAADEFNAAVFLEPTASRRLAFDTYRKATLFPLTERVPALLESSVIRQWLPWLGTWKPGGGVQVLPLRLRDGRTLLTAPLICYDTLVVDLAIAAVRRGAEIILTLSNDSWFSYDGVPRLILVITAFRSIETRRPQIRATNTGISAVITPTGEFAETIPVHQRGTLLGTVAPEHSAMTLMVAWGDWFGPTALACGIVLLAASFVSRATMSASPAAPTSRRAAGPRRSS